MPTEISTPPPVESRRFGRRHRRILKTALVLAIAGMLGALAAWKIYRDNQPEQYEPGEASTDITSTVEQQHAAPAAPARETVQKTAPKRKDADPLRDPGRRLPAGASEPRFTDVTKEAGLADFRSFTGPRSSQLPEDMGSGVAWGDFDNDGFEDLFLVSAGGALNLPAPERAPAVLYRNRGDGTFEKVQSFPDLRILGMGAAWADYDSDGWLDLVVTGLDTILLFHNNHGRLVPAKGLPSPKGFWTGASWGDYDRDGNLDLYICGYVRYLPGENRRGTQQFGLEVPYTLNPASYEPERNLLFHNNGSGTFTEVAGKLGVANPDGRSLSALWHDFDGDGWPDLYVANDISENKLYMNRGGRFADEGKSAWIAEYRGSMGLAAGDFDRDGDDDLFISHWIAQQFALYQNLAREQQEAGRKTAGVQQDLHFTDVAEIRGVGQPSLQSIGWGTAFFDFDSDGWLDLAVANGSTFETKDEHKRLEPMPAFLFWNERGQFFRDLAPWNRSLASPHVSRGLAVADFDNDGALDIAIVDLDGGVRLLRNDAPQGNWIELRLRNRMGRDQKPGFGDGATVTAWVNGVGLRRTVGGASYLSQDSRRVHIGLGKAAKVDKLEVAWPGGKTETWTSLEANRIWEIVERDPEPHATAGRHLNNQELQQFWSVQRAAMDAMKRQRDISRAATLFREALALNPVHEDSRYYLANCLAAQGLIDGAVGELDMLTRINPQSRRAWQRKGELLAAAAQGRAALAPAAAALDTALRLNPEETGVLLLQGEVELARGNLTEAERRFELANRANPRAAVALYLRGYVAWKRGDERSARSLLAAVKAARGKDWKPPGAVLEGDVQRRMFQEAGFLSVLSDEWNGNPAPAGAFSRLERFLTERFRR